MVIKQNLCLRDSLLYLSFETTHVPLICLAERVPMPVKEAAWVTEFVSVCEETLCVKETGWARQITKQRNQGHASPPATD